MAIKCRRFYDEERGHYKSAEYICETDLDKLNKFILESNLDKLDVINIIEKIDVRGKPCIDLYYWSKESE